MLLEDGNMVVTCGSCVNLKLIDSQFSLSVSLGAALGSDSRSGDSLVLTVHCVHETFRFAQFPRWYN